MMKKSLKFLSLLMSLLMIMSAISVPTFAASSEQVAVYPGSEDFFWGVDAHLGHQSYPISDIEKQVELAAKLGVKVYSIDVPTISNIGDADKLVRAANAYGMDVLLSLGGENSTPAEATEFYGLVARHYATGDFGRVKYLKIMNETDNICIADGKDGITASDYDTDKVSAMAARIKAANEAIKAVSNEFVTIVNYSWLHDPYLNLIRQQGADWDVTGINWYTNMQEHSDSNGGLSTALNKLARYDTLKDKKVIITESNTWGGSDTLSDSLKGIMDTAYKSDMVIGMCFYELLDEPGNAESEQSFGLVSYTDENGIGAVKPVYTTIQSLIGGSDSIIKGSFVPSENYPNGATNYNKAKVYTEIVTTGSTDGGFDFKETVNLNNYEAVEMDIFVNSLGTDPVDFNYVMLDSKGSSRIAENEATVPVNTWVHKVIYIDSFVFYGGSSSDICKFVIDALPDGTVVNIANFAFTCGIGSEMNNTHYTAKELNYKLFINGTKNGAYTKKGIGEVVDITAYDYLEFDTYYTGSSDSGSCNLMAVDTNGAFKVASVTFTKDTWVHCVIPTSSFAYYAADMTKVTAFQVENPNGGTYIVTNMCLTTASPKADYKHFKAVDILKSHAWSRSYFVGESLSTGVTDFTKYDYVEFDFRMTNGTPGKTQRLIFQNAGGYGFYDFVPENDKLVHFVIPVGSIDCGWGFNGDRTRFQTVTLDFGWTEDGAYYEIFNMALTTERPISKYEHYLGLELNADHTTFRDYSTNKNFGTGTTDFTKYDYLEFDFYASNATGNNRVRMVINCESGQAYYDFTPVPNKLVHYVVPISDLKTDYGYNGDKTKCLYYNIDWNFMEVGAVYSFYNLALTRENEAVPAVKGDANQDGKIDIVDLIRIKKICAELVDYNENADITDDGIVGAEDITALSKYLIGSIASFDELG